MLKCDNVVTDHNRETKEERNTDRDDLVTVFMWDKSQISAEGNGS